MGEPATILIVDDEPFNVDYLTQELEELDYATLAAEDGPTALAAATRAAPDLILLDIMLPGMSGFEVLTALKAAPATRDIPVLIISALTDMTSVVRGIDLGAEDYLAKPFDPRLLQTRIRTCLEKKRLRDLEKRYLQQELALRQNEKLATIGRLSAGLTHELNNPAAAAQRGAEQLTAHLAQTEAAYGRLLATPFTLEQQNHLMTLTQNLQERVRTPLRIDALDRIDALEALEPWLLAQLGTATAAAALVELGYTAASLPAQLALFPRTQWSALVSWLCGRFASQQLLAEIGEGAARISAIVNALKQYIYLDQGPVQPVDVQAGLESTLLLLRGKLGSGITVQRHYAPNLPPIQGYGSELNQVWTNLIDNAIGAMNGQGLLTLTTRADGDGIVVEISDTGPGIPAAIQAQIFDPFFTTKPPGQGTGLGLSIAHTVVVQKQGGQFSVTSQPGATCFTVQLPRTLPGKAL